MGILLAVFYLGNVSTPQDGIRLKKDWDRSKVFRIAEYICFLDGHTADRNTAASMIVLPNIKGWEIVSHFTHGLLAGKIAMQIRHELRPEFWEDVLTAIIEHDDHLLDFKEKNYLTDAGTPLDFTLDERSLEDAHQHAEKVYDNSLQKSHMVALMVGRHLQFLHRTEADELSKFKKFFAMVKKRRTQQLKLYGWTKRQLEDAYNVMRFCDRCSLVICQGLIPPGGRKLEINKTIDDRRYYIYQKKETLVLEPWPFEIESFTIHYEKKLLEQAFFKNNSELAAEIEKVPPSLVPVTFSK